MKVFFLLLIPLIVFAVLIIFFPLINRLMTQVIFKSEKRTRKILLRAYQFYQTEYPESSERELLLHTMRAAFCILEKHEYPMKPYSTKPKSLVTEDDVNDILAQATDIETLIQIIVERDLSPDMAPWI